MRELNECKAEVFRRSEKRIKERRKKQSQLLWCIVPFCLGIMVWSVMLLPEIELSLKESAQNDTAYETEIIDTEDSLLQIELRLEGQLADYQERITDSGEIETILDTIRNLFLENVLDESEDVMQKEEDKVSEEFVSEEYVISFYGGEGTESVYILRGNLLVDKNNQQEVVLQAEQKEHLYLLLGLTE